MSNDYNGKKRSELPDSVFGIPQERKYPMPDEKHTRSAIKLFNHVEPKYEEQLAKAVIKNMKKYNIDGSVVGPNNRLRKYLPKDMIKEYVEEACKDLTHARKLCNAVRKLARKYNANYFFVTDGASSYSNGNGKYNPAAKEMRDHMDDWERNNGFNPDDDWTNDINNVSNYRLLKESSVLEGLLKSDFSYTGIKTSTEKSEFKRNFREVFKEDPTESSINNMQMIKYKESLVGYIGFSRYTIDKKKYLGIGNFMIIKKYQHRGIGSKVISDIIDKYKDKYDEIYCYVDENNTNAISFYKKIAKVDTENLTRYGYYVSLYRKNKSSIKEETRIEDNKLPKHIYHISYINHDGETFEPRTYDNDNVKNGMERKVKRVCFSDSITRALYSIFPNGAYDADFYVHVPNSDCKVYKTTSDDIYDADITHELWIKEPVQMKCIGKIHVNGVSDKTHTIDVDKDKAGYGKKKYHETRWNWVEKYEKDETLYESYISEDDDMIKEYIARDQSEYIQYTMESSISEYGTTTGAMVGSNQPDSVYIVNYMQNNAFSGHKEPKFGICKKGMKDLHIVGGKYNRFHYVSDVTKFKEEASDIHVYRYKGKPKNEFYDIIEVMDDDDLNIYKMVTGREIEDRSMIQFDGDFIEEDCFFDEIDAIKACTETGLLEASTDLHPVPILTETVQGRPYNYYRDLNGVFIQHEITGLRSKSYETLDDIPEAEKDIVKRGYLV